MLALRRRRRRLVAAVAVAGTALAGLAASNVAEAATDRPNTLAGARGTAPVAAGSWVREKIGTATDQDWYRFDVPRAAQVTATLGGLPANYSLVIYDAAGRRVRGSDAPGVAFERVLWTAPAAGTYFARVDSAGAFSASKTYALRFRVLVNGLAVVSQHGSLMSNGHVATMAEIRNTTSGWRRIQFVEVALQDAGGRTLFLDHSTLTNIVLPPGGVSHVNTASVVPAPAGFAKVRVRPVSTPIAAPGPNPKLTVHPGRSGPGARYRGTVSTTSATPVTDASLYVNFYDAYGNLRLVEAWVVGNGTVPARGSAPYDVTMTLAPFFPRPNRVTFTPFVQRF